MVSQKGGVGKSTLAVSLGCEFMHRGHRVLIVDGDEQATARKAVGLGTASGREMPSCIGMGADMHRPNQLPLVSQNFDIVLIDTPGKLSQVSRAALVVSHLALIPIGQSAADVWTVKETVALIEEAKAFLSDLTVSVVLTRIKPQTNTGKAARKMLTDCGLSVMARDVADRVQWQECLAAGIGVAQYAPKSPAADELRAIADEIQALLWQKHERQQQAAASALKVVTNG